MRKDRGLDPGDLLMSRYHLSTPATLAQYNDSERCSVHAWKIEKPKIAFLLMIASFSIQHGHTIKYNVHTERDRHKTQNSTLIIYYYHRTRGEPEQHYWRNALSTHDFSFLPRRNRDGSDTGALRCAELSIVVSILLNPMHCSVTSRLARGRETQYSKQVCK